MKTPTIQLRDLTNPTTAHFGHKRPTAKPEKPKPAVQCIHCRWCQPYPTKDPKENELLATCERSAIVVNPFNGYKARRFCHNERSLYGECGPEALHFIADDCDTAA